MRPAPTSAWDPPPDEVTAPDQIDARALEQLERLPGERLLRCWKTPFGYLVLTTLRCAQIWHRSELFAASGWRLGPVFFFYNLAEPRVVLGRFLELAEEVPENVGRQRFLVRDPARVAAEIDAARQGGHQAWLDRRSATVAALGRLSAAPVPAGTTVVVRTVVKVRCSFCGNLIDETADRCRFCGAPQG
ncbi:MAG TPA: hypothetical protein VMG81_00625 [Thermoplasmata archaeon]|nr:hypothetical protein [Thermoplasmata archaeon]